MGSGNGATAQQAVKLGELKMAQERIEQRIDSTIKTLNEAEKLKLEAVRRKVEDEMGLVKLLKVVSDVTLKVNEKMADVEAAHVADRALLAVKQANELKELQAKQAEDVQKYLSAYNDKKAKVRAELEKKTQELGDLKDKIEKKIGDDGAEIKQKAASIRAHLNQEKSRLNDKIYATILPDNLRAVVDEAPKMGEEGKFVMLEFKVK